jgi:hypothetical protein
MVDKTNDGKKPQTTPKIWKRILFNRWLLIAVGLLTLYSLIGFLLTPWLVSRYIPHLALEKLQRRASIAEVHVNPFLLTFEAKGFQFDEANDRPILGFNRLFVDFDLSSLFKWAWTFAEIQIERPSIYTEIRKEDGRLNLAAISDNLPESEETDTVDRKPPRIIVKHAQITKGVFSFSDQSIPTPATETFSDLNLELSDISTLPESKGPYTAIAKLPGGGTIGWQGEISLHPVFSEER